MPVPKFFRAIQFFAVAILLSSTAHADLVQYQVTSLGANTWRYDYTINNTTPSAGFDELTIYFDPSKYSLLNSPVAPAGWDPLVIQPDTGIPADGYFDVLNLGGLLADGASFTGFSIEFTYLLNGTPGSQSYDLYDSSDFILVGSGRTTGAPTNDVPEPDTLALMLLGVGCIGFMRRRQNSASV